MAGRAVEFGVYRLARGQVAGVRRRGGKAQQHPGEGDDRAFHGCPRHLRVE